MRIFSKITVLSLSSLLITTALTQTATGKDDDSRERSGSNRSIGLATILSTDQQLPLDTDPLKILQKRNLVTERATLLGYTQLLEQSTPGSIRDLAETILGRTFESNNALNAEAASSYTLTIPVRVTPHSNSLEELDLFNSVVVKGGLLIKPDDEQSQNDFIFIKAGLERILAVRQEELTTAEKFKKATISSSDEEDVKGQLTEATKKASLEDDRLKLAVFHLSVVRDYIKTATEEAVDLERKADISAGNLDQIARLRGTSKYLQELLHAIYDYDRSRLMSMLARFGEHSASKSRQQTVLGQISDHASFVIDDAYLKANSGFTEALKKLLYKQSAPQLVDSFKERIQFGEKPKPAEQSPEPPAAKTTPSSETSVGWGTAFYNAFFGGSSRTITVDLQAPSSNATNQEASGQPPQQQDQTSA
jgi:hypothetical protein